MKTICFNHHGNLANYSYTSHLFHYQNKNDLVITQSLLASALSVHAVRKIIFAHVWRSLPNPDQYSTLQHQNNLRELAAQRSAVPSLTDIMLINWQALPVYKGAFLQLFCYIVDAIVGVKCVFQLGAI